MEGKVENLHRRLERDDPARRGLISNIYRAQRFLQDEDMEDADGNKIPEANRKDHFDMAIHQIEQLHDLMTGSVMVIKKREDMTKIPLFSVREIYWNPKIEKNLVIEYGFENDIKSFSLAGLGNDFDLEFA